MFSKIKKYLYEKKLDLLYSEGIVNKEILPFEEELFERLNNVFINGIPITLFLKYDRPLPYIQPGQCYDRSLLLTMGMDEAILVRGNNTDLALRYGEEGAGHGWVEKDGWVYDTSLMKKIKKERYYEMYLPYNVHYYKPNEYQCSPDYQEIFSTTIEDLKNKGRKRFFLVATIPIFQELAKKSGNIEFQTLLANHLKRINYDFDLINQELIEEINKKSCNNSDIIVVKNR